MCAPRGRDPVRGEATGAWIHQDDLALPFRIEQIQRAGDLARLHLVRVDVHAAILVPAEVVAVRSGLVDKSTLESALPVLVTGHFGVDDGRRHGVPGAGRQHDAHGRTWRALGNVKRVNPSLLLLKSADRQIPLDHRSVVDSDAGVLLFEGGDRLPKAGARERVYDE